MRRFFSPITIILLFSMVFMSMRSGSFSNPMDWFMSKIYIIPGVIIGLAFHEFGHAFVADRLGDPTPKAQNRVTLNPASHIDPIGLIALFFVGFGWGIPVQVNADNFKKPRRDFFLVSLAGVVMNLLLAVAFTLIIKLVIILGGFPQGAMGDALYQILFFVIHINLVLMVFNLLPIPPLDGFNVITEIFNLKKYDWWYKVYQKGFLILMVFIVFNLTGRILTPAVSAMWSLLSLILY